MPAREAPTGRVPGLAAAPRVFRRPRASAPGWPGARNPEPTTPGDPGVPRSHAPGAIAGGPEVQSKPMPNRPSEPILRLIRDTARKRGLNTAALARAAGIERARLKHVLAGSEPLTVDDFIRISEALQFDPGELGALPAEGGAPATGGDEAPADPRVPEAMPRVHAGPDAIVPDPLGNHAEQALRLGYGMGCDILLVLDTAKAADSGIPRHVLSRFPERLSIRLDAAYHAPQDPRFLPEGFRVNLSFDSLYTVLIPWEAIEQVVFVPLPPEPLPDAPPEPGPGGHLRLVK